MSQTEQLFYDLFQTSVGWIAAVASTHGLISVSLPEKTPQCAFYKVATKYPGVVYSPEALQELRVFIKEYIEGKSVVFGGVLDLNRASTFLRKVLETVRAIPEGETMTYKEIAIRIGKPKATRAVGQSISRNPLPLIIPCHRVIGTDGKLHGYQGGLEKKRGLLLLEASAAVKV